MCQVQRGLNSFVSAVPCQKGHQLGWFDCACAEMKQENEASRPLTCRETARKRRTEVLMKGPNTGEGGVRTASVLCHQWSHFRNSTHAITSGKLISIFMQLHIPWRWQTYHMSNLKCMLVITHHFAIHCSAIKSEICSKQNFKLHCSSSTTMKAEITYQLSRDLYFFQPQSKKLWNT